MAKFTTEQSLPVKFTIVDGRGRAAPIEGSPQVVSSDETVAKAGEVTQGENGAWNFNVESVTAGAAKIVMTADADLGEGVNQVIGELDVEVELDPRTSARMVRLEVGEPVDEPA